MEQLFAYLQTQPWWAIVSAVIASASIIAAATPKPKPGSVIEKIYKVINFLAINIGNAKNKAASPGTEPK